MRIVEHSYQETRKSDVRHTGVKREGRDPVCSVDPERVLALLRSLPLLHQVAEVALKNISEALQTVQFGAGESIVKLHSEGAGLYIIWEGEAKVVSPPNDFPFGHEESLLRNGDYFGRPTTGPFREKYEVDIVAIKEVFCLLLSHENADLLSACSVWDWDSRAIQGPSNIERIFQLETIDEDFFRTSVPVPYGSDTGNYYGGQFVSQALLAATKSVNSELSVHSLHSYFIKRGDENLPVVYQVHRTRDGVSFATRHVEARQESKIVFVLYASFKRPEEGLEHSEPMPSVPDPEELEGLEQNYESFLTDARLPLATKKEHAGPKRPLQPIEIRYVSPLNKFRPVKTEPRFCVWMRSREKLPEGPVLHQCVGAYATDLALIGAGRRVHPEVFGLKLIFLSLDHTIWFHQPFNADEWLLYFCESTRAMDGRSLNFGRVFSRDGVLVMSVAQEGLIRRADGKPIRTARL